MSYQLSPPTVTAPMRLRELSEHLRNILKHALPQSIPAHLWDRLLPQAEITLSLLRSSSLHPQLYATANYRGLIDYNKTC
jgi:hypothetical protein